MNKYRMAFAALLLALATCVLILRGTFRDSQRPRSSDREEESAGVAQQAARSTGAGTTGVRTALDSAVSALTKLVVVTGPGGAPLEAARIGRVGAKRPLYRPSEIAALGTTDAAGRLSFPWQSEAPAGSTEQSGWWILVAKSGYVSRAVDVGATATEHHVTLEQAHAIEVLASDSRDRAVSGVRVLAYATECDADTLAADSLEGPGTSAPSKGANYSEANTDSAGRAVLELLPGRYTLSCLSSYHFMTNVVGGGVEVPANGPIRVRMAPIMAGIVDLELGNTPTRRLAHVVKPKATDPRWKLAGNVFAARACDRARGYLGANDRRVVVAEAAHVPAKTTDGEEAAPYMVTVSMLLDGVGWVDRELRLLPVAEVVPIVVHSADLLPEFLGELEIGYAESMRGLSVAPRLRVTTEYSGSRAAITVQQGDVLHVPPGDYQLVDCRWQTLHRLHVVADSKQVAKVPETYALVPVTINVHYADGRVPYGSIVTIREAQSRSVVAELRPSNPKGFPWALPSGSYSVDIRVGMRERVSKPGIVVAPGHHVIEVVLPVEE